MAKLYKDIFMDVIKEQINSGQFKDKQELITFLHDFNTQYFNNPQLMQKLKQAGINLKELDVNKATEELLAYYDRGKTDVSSLNLDGVSQVEIDGKDYIKVQKEDGMHQLLDDSMNNDNFVKQFQDRQNESYDYQTNDGVKNRDEIIKDMEHDKTEVKLTASTNVNTRDLTPEERREFAAIMGISDAEQINFIVDPVRNIYINKDNGELFYAHKNAEGKLEIRKAEGTTAETIQNDSNAVDTMDNDTTIAMEESLNVDFEKLDDFELKIIYDSKFESLTPEQKETLLRVMKKRQERTMTEEENKKIKEEVGLQKVLTLDMLNKPHNGFTSIIYLSLLTLLFGIGIVLYLTIKIYM